jgi:predicted dehydrogenase
MLKVAIVGCGKIADDHASQIGRIPDCRIVAACDREPMMARQLGERFTIGQYFGDVAEMLYVAKPDVVHVTTPPESHFDIANLILENNCHAYIEKPFTLRAEEAIQLIALANQKALKITAGHDLQFSHVSRRVREVVNSGFLGGQPLHMESYYCYELGANPYAGALLGDKRHWVRRLPGKLLHNIISHGIAHIAEFLTGNSLTVIAHGFTSPHLRRAGETEIIDELRVIISEEERTTAYFTFSSQMRPSVHQLRLYGARNGLVLDHQNETLIKLRGARYPSYLEKFVPPVAFAGQYLSNIAGNVRRFAQNDFHAKSGMKYLIQSFYRAIVERAPVPIPYQEIILTAKIMDAIFSQLASRHSTLASVSAGSGMDSGNLGVMPISVR